LVFDQCLTFEDDPGQCKQLVLSSTKTFKAEKRLKIRRGLGIGFFSVAAITLALGITQMLTPLGATETGCLSHGLDVPCIPDRFPLGGGLLGTGLLLTSAGILTLTIRF